VCEVISLKDSISAGKRLAQAGRFSANGMDAICRVTSFPIHRPIERTRRHSRELIRFGLGRSRREYDIDSLALSATENFNQRWDGITGGAEACLRAAIA
jgi:hypothetical protein